MFTNLLAALVVTLPMTATAAGTEAAPGAELVRPAVTSADFTHVNNVCRPNNANARAYAIDLQRQLRRVAFHYGLEAPPESGNIGGATVLLFARVQQLSHGELGGDTSSCILIAADADVLAEQVRELANSIEMVRA